MIVFMGIRYQHQNYARMIINGCYECGDNKPHDRTIFKCASCSFRTFEEQRQQLYIAAIDFAIRYGAGPLTM